MTVESDFYTLLSGNAGVTALVGTRIYPDALPEESAYPAVAFARTRTERLIGLSGQIFGADVDLSVGCWAETRTDADAVATAVESALTGSAFVSAARSTELDPDVGLFGTILTVTTFATA